MKNKVSVIIPMYQAKMSETENLSLAQAIKILSGYQIVIIKPKSLDLTFIQKKYQTIEFESFDDEYFKGIYGYNRLMLSSIFYERFIQFDYILIYQLDAWVFRDELEYWCNKDYDYIGAPWIMKPKYNLLPYRLYIRLISKYFKLTGKNLDRELRRNKVGNGGFSLRKVKSFYQATLKQKEKIAYNIEHGKVKLNEDVFWAVENPDFKYPHHTEAVKFAFDRNPHICLKMNNNSLPFGCHAWPSFIKFWKTLPIDDMGHL